MKFDPESEKQLYAQKDTDELVRIAFLEDTYLEEAKELAKWELARRRPGGVDQRTIDRVRADMKRQRLAKIEEQWRGLESEEQIPFWRQAIRKRLAPYRNILLVAMMALVAASLLSSFFNWSVFGIDGRKLQGFGLLAVFLMFAFVMPTRREFREKHFTKDGKRK